MSNVRVIHPEVEDKPGYPPVLDDDLAEMLSEIPWAF
jgi:hypothetical protein